MKKAFIFILCTAMLICLSSGVVFASDAAAKLGIEKGNIVSFAGKDGTPIKWRVIDPDKTNTGADGMFLLSEDTAQKVAVNTISCNDEDSLKKCFKPTYTAFYNAYFADFYRNAVIAESCVDASVFLGNETAFFKGELSGDTVFALSIEETQKLGLDERKYDGKKWILRSARRRKKPISANYIYEFAYVDSSIIDSADQNAKITYNEITSDNKTEYYFRPAVNIDKAKLAQLDGKPLLLPIGEFLTADNSVAALENAGEWKLVQSDDAKITQTYVAVRGDGEYTVTVGTDLENADGDDYISLLIKKSDGSISHYGRYAMTAAEKSFDITVPSGFDRENDTVYVFYENYRGALSGSAGELTAICLHEYDCVSLDNELHSFICKKCGYSEQKQHNLTLTETADDCHTLQCDDCGKVITENHKYSVIDQTDEQHTLECTVCGNTKTGDHTYEKITTKAVRNISCTDCGKQLPFMAAEVDFSATPEFNGKETAIRTEYDTTGTKFLNCAITNKEYFFKYSSIKRFSYIPQGQMCGVTFKTLTPVRATGFRIVAYQRNTVPNNIILYGKKSGSSDEYKEIGSAFLKPILSEETDCRNKTYAFLFTGTSDFAAYDDFKLEMDVDVGSDIELKYFGLISDKGSSFTISADGAMVDGYQPSYAYPDEDFALTLVSKNGHPKQSEIRFTTDGEIQWVNPIYSYNADTGVFRIPGSKIESGRKYNLDVTCADKTIDVSFNLDRATVIDKTQTPEFGIAYTCVFRDADGETTYAPTKQDIQVLCFGNDITQNCTYTDCTLTIPGKYVTGDITITANEKFGIQKSNSNVRVDRPGEATRWYDCTQKDSAAMFENINSGGDVTVTVIKSDSTILSSTGSSLVFAAGNVTLDLNNYKFSARPINVRAGANLTVKNGTYGVNMINQKNVVDNGAVLTFENVTTSAIDVNGKLIVNNTLAQRKISDVVLRQESELTVKNGRIDNLKLYQPKSVNIYCGIVGNTSSYKDDSDTEALAIDYDGLLGDGCEFYDITLPDAFAKGEPSGFSVKCLHSVKNVDPKTGICICGSQVPKILTENGSTVIFYDDILSAIEYANKNPDTTIRIFRNVEAEVLFDSNIPFTGNNTTLDLNGKTLKTTEEDIYFSISGSLTVTGDGTLGSLLRAEQGSTLIIESGTFDEVDMISRNVTLSGGKFTVLHKDNRVTFFSAYLDKNKAYRSTETGRFNNDLYEDTSMGEFLENVEVTDVPFIVTSVLKDIYVEAGTEYVPVSIEVLENENYRGEVEYTWGVYKETSKEYSQYLSSGKNKFPNINIQTYELDSGVHLIYQSTVLCNGYVIKSDMAAITIGTGKPVVEIYPAGGYYVVDAAGNDCVLAAAAYSGNRFLGIKFKELTKESSVLKLDDVFTLSEIAPEKDRDSVSEIKLFIWNSLNGMTPLSEAASISTVGK